VIGDSLTLSAVVMVSGPAAPPELPPVAVLPEPTAPPLLEAALVSVEDPELLEAPFDVEVELEDELKSDEELEVEVEVEDELAVGDEVEAPDPLEEQAAEPAQVEPPEPFAVEPLGGVPPVEELVFDGPVVRLEHACARQWKPAAHSASVVHA
jgi:hypothetical protein